MGSIDAPDWVKEKMKSKVQQPAEPATGVSQIDAPDWVKKKAAGTTKPLDTSDHPIYQSGSPASTNSILDKSFNGFKLRPIQGKMDASGNAVLKTPDKLYNVNDDTQLDSLTNKYNPATLQGAFNVVGTVKETLWLPENQDNEVSKNPYTEKLNQANLLETSIKNKIIDKKASLTSGGSTLGTQGLNTNMTQEEDAELSQIQTLKKKISAELTIDDTNKIDAVIRTDQSGNLLNKAVTRFKMLTGDVAAAAEYGTETQDKISKLPDGFLTGLNYFKNADPSTFERLTNSVKNGLPISESQIAQVTSEGLAIEQARLERRALQKDIQPDEYNAQMKDLQKKKYDNLINNKETLRAFLSNGIAERGDAAERKKRQGLAATEIVDDVLGFRWNYDDNEIKEYGEKEAIANGLDPKSPQVQEAIKYLQDNEGSFILQNSIAKNGIAREFGKGLAEPVRGVVSGIADIGRDSNDVYVEGQSQGNVNVSEQRLKAQDIGWRGVMNDVVKGAGQFVTQAGVALATSGLLGAVTEGALGAYESSAVGQLISLPSEVNAAVGAANDFASTLMTSFAQVYDSNLKSALNYTSDNSLAKKAAFINSTIEGLSENILSPIDVAKRIFKTKGATEGLLKVLSEENLVANPNKLTDFLKSTIRAAGETLKVGGTEIAEGFVTQIADFTTNAYLNPNSQSFQNRDLANELAQTAYQTGLSMAVPALASGVKAFNANTFAKGSLMIAAQNRRQLIDNLDTKLSQGDISQDDYNSKVQIINTAAKAHENIPVKENGTALTPDEKADYVFSRTSEAFLTKKMDESGDEAEKIILNKKIKEQQEFRTEFLNSNTNETDKQQGSGESGQASQSDGTTVNETANASEAGTQDAVQNEQLLNTNAEADNTASASGVPVRKRKVEAAVDPIERAKEIVNTEGAIKGFTGPVLQEAAKSNPEEFQQHLKDIADQANDPNSNKATVETYGKELVDIAQKLNPEVTTRPKEVSTEPIPALRDVESTAKALDADKIKQIEDITGLDASQENLNEGTTPAKYLASMYHFSKKDGTNPELVKAVESLLKEQPTEPKQSKVEQTTPVSKVVGEVKIVKYEDATKITHSVSLDNLPQGIDEQSREARSQIIRKRENTPPKFKEQPIGTYAVDKYGEAYQLQSLPIEDIVTKSEGTQKKETVDKYAEWQKKTGKMLPVSGVENYAVHKGKVVITDGQHRVLAAKKNVLKEIPVWVALTDPNNHARPLLEKDIQSHSDSKSNPTELIQSKVEGNKPATAQNENPIPISEEQGKVSDLEQSYSNEVHQAMQGELKLDNISKEVIVNNAGKNKYNAREMNAKYKDMQGRLEKLNQFIKCK